MNFPEINEFKCPASEDIAQGICPDDRCSDPTFAAGNPILCGRVLTLVLKPETTLLCKDTGATQTFRTYARSASGEVLLTAGVVYASSDPSILAIGQTTGVATAVGAGIATVTATVASFGQSAYAQVTVITDGCCEEVCVNTVLLWDVSGSMHPMFKGSRAGYVVKHMVLDTLNGTKDWMTIIAFNSAIVLNKDWSNVPATLYAPPLPQHWYDGTTTDIQNAVDAALAKFGSAPACTLSARQQVIVLISDGADVPSMSESQVANLIAQCQGFKNSGGIIVGVGINANGDGYALLQAIASGGFFVNDHGNGAEAAVAVQLLKNLVGYYCGCSATVYPGGCPDSSPPGPQAPDLNAPADPEPGSTTDVSDIGIIITPSPGDSITADTTQLTADDGDVTADHS